MTGVFISIATSDYLKVLSRKRLLDLIYLANYSCILSPPHQLLTDLMIERKYISKYLSMYCCRVEQQWGHGSVLEMCLCASSRATQTLKQLPQLQAIMAANMFWEIFNANKANYCQFVNSIVLRILQKQKPICFQAFETL